MLGAERLDLLPSARLRGRRLVERAARLLGLAARRLELAGEAVELGARRRHLVRERIGALAGRGGVGLRRRERGRRVGARGVRALELRSALGLLGAQLGEQHRALLLGLRELCLEQAQALAGRVALLTGADRLRAGRLELALERLARGLDALQLGRRLGLADARGRELGGDRLGVGAALLELALQRAAPIAGALDLGRQLSDASARL